jgi:hypothetical protein
MDTCAKAQKFNWVGEETTGCGVYYSLLMVSI